LALNKPSVVVLVNGGTIAIDNLVDPAPAIIEAFYPSMRGAEVIYQNIFGLNNRWGRLPVTIYGKDFEQTHSLKDFDMTSGLGRTYRYYKGKALFEFGHGLSYSEFDLNCDA